MAKERNPIASAQSRIRPGAVGVDAAAALPSPQLAVIGALLAAAIVFGGGGSPSPGSEVLLQMIAAAAMLALTFGPAAMRGWPQPPRAAWAVAGLVLLLPALQLVPLPPGWWQLLPGRALATDALALVGEDRSWRPWSLFPARTLAGLLAIVVPAMLLLAVCRLDAREHRFLLGVLVVLALVSLALGALQLAGGPTSPFRFYSQSNLGFVNGFQANRNAQADVLLIGIVALGVWFGTGKRRPSRSPGALFPALGLALLSLGVVLTGSRTGVALLVPTAALATLIAFGPPSRRGLGVLLGGLVTLVGAAAYLLSANPALNRVARRFMLSEDARVGLWTDALFAIETFWPFGAGLGSAAPVLAMVERLEVVDPTRPNRVHNDFLELALETGIFGPIVLMAIVVLLGHRCVLRLRDNDVHNRRTTLGALAILAIIAIHSLVDYPLRSMAPACLAALAGGIILARRSRGPLAAGDGGSE